MIAFVYNHRHRLLDDPKVRFTKNLDLIITGTDADHGKVRTFRVDRIQGKVKSVALPEARRAESRRQP